ncbi:MAG: hypothetical protein AAGN15_22565 [Cyanobacteria bacterium J06581_3]
MAAKDKFHSMGWSAIAPPLQQRLIIRPALIPQHNIRARRQANIVFSNP